MAIWSRCGKTEVMGCVELGGGTSSVWFSRAMPMRQGLSPIRQPEGCQNLPWVLHPGSHLGEIDLIHLLLAVTPTRMTHWGLPSPEGWQAFQLWQQRVSDEGGSASWNISCTWGWAYNALSGGDWWQCLHFGPPSHTKDSESPHWSGIVHPDHVCPSGPLPLGTLVRVPL